MEMDATTTLAESLLDDLDDLSDVEEGGEEDTETERTEPVDDNDGSNGVVNGEEEDTKNINSCENVKRTRRVIDDPNLSSHMTTIHQLQSTSTTTTNTDNDSIDDQTLITTSNKHLRTLETELTRTHTDLTTLYEPHFPELDDLVPDPLQYKNAIKVIQNHTDMTLINEELNSIARLTANQIITLSVAGSTTAGSPLTTPQLHMINHRITQFETLQIIKHTILQFLANRMERTLPNTCTLIGPTLTARLLGAAGGMTELSRIPACNLQVLGQVKGTSGSRGGMGTSVVSAAAAGGANLNFTPDGATMTMERTTSFRPHEGIIAECALHRSVPLHLKRKALKVIAAKLALCIRCDIVNVETGRRRTQDTGLSLRRGIEETFGKWEDPDMAQVLKALPKPDLTTKKRRGGRRMRRLKERFEQTEMMKQANRRGFSVETGEYGDDAMGLTLGMLEKPKDGSSSTGGGTAAGVGNSRRQYAQKNGGDTKKMKYANTKASRKRAAEMGLGGGGGGQSSGTASSMVFTPVQGMELVNPDARADKVREANRKWFGENSGFQSALPKTK